MPDTKSGLYHVSTAGLNFELRLDVDGHLPLNKVSVSITNRGSCHWIADLHEAPGDSWSGPIWYTGYDARSKRFGGQVTNSIRVSWRQSGAAQMVEATFLSDGANLFALTLTKDSSHFREVEIEVDTLAGVDMPTTYNPADHPVRPHGLEGELSLEAAFEEAGVRITRTPGENAFTGEAGDAWNDTELHDAMVDQWSRPDGKLWSLWVLAATRYEDKPDPQTKETPLTLGIMFDATGNFQRNGAVVFSDAIDTYVRRVGEGDEHLDAAIQRQKFRCLIHEIGHAFNLSHSWDKTRGLRWNDRVTDEPEAFSYMNYPHRVTGGDAEYWANFGFRFSDQELLFMRHAPDDYVAMGGRSFLTSHADLGAAAAVEDWAPHDEGGCITGLLKLDVRFPNRAPVFAFMEPVIAEVRITNSADGPLYLPPGLLDQGNLSITLTHRGARSCTVHPYRRCCRIDAQAVEMSPGDKAWEEIYLSSSPGVWHTTEPGRYDVSVELRTPIDVDGTRSELVAAGGTTFYVRRPDRQGEIAAQDVFSDGVGRVIHFNGSRAVSLQSALATVTKNTDRFGVVAQAAMYLPSLRSRKGLGGSPSVPDADAAKHARKLVKGLIDAGPGAVRQLGHVRFLRLCLEVADRAMSIGEASEARRLAKNARKVLKKRQVKLPQFVQDEITARISS